MLKKPDFGRFNFGRFIRVLRKGSVAERRALAVKWFAASAFIYAFVSLVSLLTVHPLASILFGCGSLVYGCLAVVEYVLLRKADKSTA